MNRPFFKFFRTTDEILSFIWNDYGVGGVNGQPVKTLWNKDTCPTVCDIKFWEQLYHEPGNLGIYAAHDPFVELYIIVYYPIVDSNFNGITEYYGDTAVEDILDISNKLGIRLELTPSK
jgi:hypothetical protein